jgi:hypothetical protein
LTLRAPPLPLLQAHVLGCPGPGRLPGGALGGGDRLSHALALAGDVDAARERFEHVTAYANDVSAECASGAIDLLGEQVDG